MTWPIFRSYTWIFSWEIGSGTWFLAPGPDATTSSIERWYDPMQSPALFRAFAETSTSRDGIAAFAQQWGSLVMESGDDQTTSAAPFAVSLQRWQQEIVAMRQMLALWDLVQADDREGLAERIFWRQVSDSSKAVLYDSGQVQLDEDGADPDELHLRLSLASQDINPVVLASFPPDDVFAPACTCLQQAIDARLRDSVRLRYVIRQVGQRPSFDASPDTLLAALWLQLALAISEDRHFRRCRGCGTWLLLSPEIARTNRVFCTNACRARLYRRRQDRAKRMYTKEGKNLKAIAVEVNADVATVQRWVTGKKEDL
jgi:hypothetical protein